MKLIAYLAIAFLQVTGLSVHVDEAKREQLAVMATGQTSISTPATPATAKFTPGSLPVRIATEPLNIAARASLALDAGSGTVLYASNDTSKQAIASITKIVTAMVILERHALTDIITIPTLPAYGPDDEIIGLVPGEQYSAEALIRALLVQSANDAADALAIADAGNIEKFSNLMNAKMSLWGISRTHFVGPSGLVDTGNYSTANDLAKIARLFLTNAFVRQVISQQSGEITSTSGRIIPIRTTNQLLYTGNFYGIKTGYTLAAGECFVGLTRINGHEVITVVLGSSDRFGATQTLTNWIDRNWAWL